MLQIAASIAPRDGGPTTNMLSLNIALNRAGMAARIITTDADGTRDALSRDARDRLHRSGADVTLHRRSGPGRLKNSWGLAADVWTSTRTAEVAHIHGLFLAHNIWAYLACRLRRIPYTVQPHGALEPYQRHHGRLRKAVWNVVIGNRLIRHARAIAAASPSEASNIVDLYPGARVCITSPILLTASGVAGEEGQAHWAQWLSVPRPQRVLFLGRLAAKKRPDLLIQAWNQVSGEAQLAVAGPAETWSQESLRGRLTAHARQSTTLSEHVDAHEAGWLFRHAGIFVLPSENENFGITVAEALVHGCAVLTTSFVAASRHVTAANAGQVLADLDARTLTEALQDLLDHPERVAEMGSRAESYAQGAFSGGTTLAALHSAWNLTTERTPSPAGPVSPAGAF